jgi:hypothetical protein
MPLAQPSRSRLLASMIVRTVQRYAAKTFSFLKKAAHSVFCWLSESRSGIVNWIFRLLSLLGVFYLVYDRIYETGATISSAGSDPKNPLYFPFSISNNSHIFTLRHIDWKCQFVKAELLGFTPNNVGFGFGGTANEIAPGDILNGSCRRAIGGMQAQSNISMYVDVQYDTNILGYTLYRHPRMLFTWAPDSTNPQWIRGEIAK